VSQLEVFTSVMTFSNLGYDEKIVFFSFYAVTIFSPLLPIMMIAMIGERSFNGYE
jgi:hypothetical protein